MSPDCRTLNPEEELRDYYPLGNDGTGTEEEVEGKAAPFSHTQRGGQPLNQRHFIADGDGDPDISVLCSLLLYQPNTLDCLKGISLYNQTL